jgi:death-on-curing protein
MQFNNYEYQKEYEKLIADNPDMDSIREPLINISDTLKAYFALADYFTDISSSAEAETMLVNVRSMDLLCSAIGRQVASFDGHVKYKNPLEICSTLFYGMVKNHSFSDGNKRTALLVLLYQLNLYNYLPNCRVSFFEHLVISVAANNLEKDYAHIWKKHKRKSDPEVLTIADLLRTMTKKKDHSFHIKITMKEMVAALTDRGVICTVGNGKIHFERYSRRFDTTYKYSATFGGWTRSVGPQTAREILEALNLYDQFSDYQSFIDGQDLYYNLIEDFEIPLRRLKDE